MKQLQCWKHIVWISLLCIVDTYAMEEQIFAEGHPYSEEIKQELVVKKLLSDSSYLMSKKRLQRRVPKNYSGKTAKIRNWLSKKNVLRHHIYQDFLIPALEIIPYDTHSVLILFKNGTLKVCRLETGYLQTKSKNLPSQIGVIRTPVRDNKVLFLDKRAIYEYDLTSDTKTSVYTFPYDVSEVRLSENESDLLYVLHTTGINEWHRKEKKSKPFLQDICMFPQCFVVDEKENITVIGSAGGLYFYSQSGETRINTRDIRNMARIPGSSWIIYTTTGDMYVFDMKTKSDCYMYSKAYSEDIALHVDDDGKIIFTEGGLLRSFSVHSFLKLWDWKKGGYKVDPDIEIKDTKGSSRFELTNISIIYLLLRGITDTLAELKYNSKAVFGITGRELAYLSKLIFPHLPEELKSIIKKIVVIPRKLIALEGI